ncbi:MAG: PhzF family phenazine biosynthesis protein [Acidaminococcus sp.]|jgi:PhzF family phenazine biosynthesis protein|nr:PhzF family phenazine biosynthesis protein [Acidaminococcus sp.]MCI2099799.1 PhzF family phenazine biosynthesis protein [Acidaminococcus sp.]MCI2114027.1 PhzF family phenazine biosynthesis protein [Acidaminococcus sp.]MCI2115897.1 PhzF family phenazine biosynthesis protein [Acidaminococcus sp.]
MKKIIKQYNVDAFSDTVFAGNQAAVCILDEWLPEDIMKKMTAENNFSETAFAVCEGGDRYHLRWFTPAAEIELCGHATLATAFVIMTILKPECSKVEFDTLSGLLTVTKDGDLFTLDFPSNTLKPVEITEDFVKAIGVKPKEVYLGDDMLCVLDNEDEVRSVVPNQEVIAKLDGVCFHITAPGKDYDCVTRTFAPKCGVYEDPVCGRAHCHVIPYWAKKMGKNDIKAFQASKRGGELYCRYAGDRTYISGKATLFAEVTVHLETVL